MPTEPQSQPLVSIIVPVYNAADHIARCIESIRRQTYRNLEIILLNDGSKDVSYAVCQSYAGIDHRIVVIDKNNSGVSATRNLGMQEAHGKYFQFVDASSGRKGDGKRVASAGQCGSLCGQREPYDLTCKDSVRIGRAEPGGKRPGAHLDE